AEPRCSEEETKRNRERWRALERDAGKHGRSIGLGAADEDVEPAFLVVAVTKAIAFALQPLEQRTGLSVNQHMQRAARRQRFERIDDALERLGRREPAHVDKRF